MNTFTLKPYGMEVETGHTILLFSPTEEIRRSSSTPFIRFQPDEYVLFYPHWYRASEQGILQCVGRSRVSAQETGSTRGIDWQLDVETLLAHPLTRYALQICGLTFVCFLNLRYLVALALAGEEPPKSFFPPCSFVLLGTRLYATDQQGCLSSYLGEISGQTMRNEPAFHRRLKKLTGIDSRTDVQSLQVPRRKYTH